MKYETKELGLLYDYSRPAIWVLLSKQELKRDLRGNPRRDFPFSSMPVLSHSYHERNNFNSPESNFPGEPKIGLDSGDYLLSHHQWTTKKDDV